MNLTAQYSFQLTSDQSGAACMMHAIYSKRLAYLSMGLRKPREHMKFGQPYSTEGNTQHIKYSMDTRVRYNILVSKSQKGSIEALNFLILTSSITL